MKKLMLFAAAVSAAVMTLSCKQEKVQETLPQVTLTADAAFSGNTANAVLTLSEASANDVSVILASASKDSKGNKPIAAESLEYERPVTIKAGSTTATVVITLLNPASVAKGSEAAITVAGAVGANRGNPDTAYILYDGSNSGGGNTGGLSLQSSWSVTLDGEPYMYQGDGYQDVTVNASDIQYFWLDAYTDEQLKQEYGSVEEMVKAWEQDTIDGFADGDELEDLLFANGEEGTYVSYPGEGPAKIYLVEFTADGKATGRYGISEVTVAELVDNTPKYEPGLPAAFTAKEGLAVEYIGRYTDNYEDEEGNEVSGDFDVFSAAGTGDALWFLSVEDKGTITDVPSYAEALSTYLSAYFDAVYEQYGWLYELLGEPMTPADILFSGTFADGGYTEYEAMPDGEYEAIVFLLDEEGNFTGEYGFAPIQVDGRSFEWPDDGEDSGLAAPARRMKVCGTKSFGRKVFNAPAPVHRKIR